MVWCTGVNIGNKADHSASQSTWLWLRIAQQKREQIKLPQWIRRIFKTAIICPLNKFDGLWLCGSRLLQSKCAIFFLVQVKRFHHSGTNSSMPQYRNSFPLFSLFIRFARKWPVKYDHTSANSMQLYLFIMSIFNCYWLQMEVPTLLPKRSFNNRWSFRLSWNGKTNLLVTTLCCISKL